MADLDPRIATNPAAPFTHQELLIDFLDLPANHDFTVNVTGPLAQPYWANLRTGADGRAQLFWRTQAAGEYRINASSNEIKLNGGFTVMRQEGEPEGPPVAAVKTVEPEPESAPEPAKPKTAPKRPARRKTSASRK